MKCPNCGTENQSGFKYCVRCGINMSLPLEADLDNVSKGGYYSEGDASGGFTIGNGTFTVKNRPASARPPKNSTADKMNDTEGLAPEFFEEPFIPKLDAERVSLPEQVRHPQHDQQRSVHNCNMQPVQQNMGMPQQMMGGMPPQQQNMPQMNGIPTQQMYQQPPFMGCDQNGSPLYGQPVMYQQPQFMGYDQNGNPVYSQPVMYQQPQFMGCDPNGNPVYSQPAMFPQMQFLGYDQNGNPLYGMPAPYQPQQTMQGVPAVPQQNGMMSGIMAVPDPLMDDEEEEEEKMVDVPDDFWEFFDGGKATRHKESSDSDFFGKHDGAMDDLFSGSDKNRLRRFEHKRNDYMSDTPIADASLLRPNDSEKFNRLYMRKTEMADASKLEYNQKTNTQDRMRVTREVSADSLVKNRESLKWNIMGKAENADGAQLETYAPQRKQAIMAHADHAVQAMPSKVKTTNDLIDEIELPANMKVKRTVKNETVEIPSLPELQELYKKG